MNQPLLEKNNRYAEFDLLRCIGILLIILVHVEIPNVLQQLRCFDVPLMIFISGLIYSNKKVDDFWQFVVRRAKRLLIPVWLFYLIILIPGAILCNRLNLTFMPEMTMEKAVSALCLMRGGFGYLWIIRVFLLVMLVTPILIKLCKYLNRYDSKWLNLYFLVLLVLQSAIVYLPIKLGMYESTNVIVKATAFIYDNYIIYLTGYSVMFIMGMILSKLQKRRLTFTLQSLTILAIAAVIMYLQCGNLNISPEYKYPPRLYFLIYGYCISAILWLNVSFFKNLANIAFVKFVGQNTIWLYLWHIPFVYFANAHISAWPLRYIFVLGCSLLIFWGQKHLISRNNNMYLSKYLLG